MERWRERQNHLLRGQRDHGEVEEFITQYKGIIDEYERVMEEEEALIKGLSG